MKNYERILKFDITFFTADIKDIKKAHKILKHIPLSSRMRDEDVNYDLVVKSAANFACIYGRDEEFIKDLREKCYYEANRMKTNSISNTNRAKQGRKLIESDTVTVGIRDNCVANLFAIMKSEMQIETLTMETFLHTIALYYSNRVINSFEKKPNKRFKSCSQIRREEEERTVTGKFTTFKDAFENAIETKNKTKVTEPEVEVDFDEPEEEIKESEIIVTKRDKKKLKKQINNIAHNIVFEELSQKEQEEIEILRKEKESLLQEIKMLHIEKEKYIIDIKKTKEQLMDISEIFMMASMKAEDNSNSIDVDKSWNVVMMNRIIAARKMRGMSIDKQEKQLANLSA